MSKSGAHDELQPDGTHGEHGDGGQPGTSARLSNPCRCLNPALACKKGNTYHNAEERLSQGCVSRRDRRRQVEQYGEAAKHALSDHRTQSTPPKNAHPAALIYFLRPDSNPDGEKADKLSQHSMPVLKLNSTQQWRNTI